MVSAHRANVGMAGEDDAWFASGRFADPAQGGLGACASTASRQRGKSAALQDRLDLC